VHRRNRLGLLAKRGRRVPVVGPAAHLFVRTGVRATYRLHDRFLSNPEARKRHQERPPALDERQAGIVAQLREEGLAVIPFGELFGAELWEELVESSAEFARGVEADGPRGSDTKTKKPYLLRAYAPGPVELPPANPWLRLGAAPRLLDVVNAYVGLWSKLSYVDQWYTRPNPEAAARVASQRWHRDYNDKHLLKVFLYMTDVDAGAGPFEYVPGSMIGGSRFADLFPWQIFGEDLYPPEGELQRNIPPDASRLLTGPAGTLILCDTTGFHRGGFATERPRIMGVWNYVSPASLASLSERNFTVPPLPSGAPEPVRYALS
jgi:hypothetical protein